MSNDLPTLDQTAPSRDGNRGRFVIEILLRHWMLIAVCSIICAAAGATIGAVMHSVKREYWAETDLVIKQSFWESPALSSLGTNAFGKITPTDLVNRLDMSALSRDITEALIQDDIAYGRNGGGLTDDSELDSRSASLLQALSIQPYDEKGLFKVLVKSVRSHEEAIRVAEFTARALVDHTQLQRADQQRQAYEVVQQQLDELCTQLDEAEGSQWDFREKMGFLTHEQVWDDIENKNMELIETTAMSTSGLVFSTAVVPAEVVEPDEVFTASVAVMKSGMMLVRSSVASSVGSLSVAMMFGTWSTILGSKIMSRSAYSMLIFVDMSSFGIWRSW